ncbi:MAG: hypothetical protein CMF12_04030 [Idiomarina sp.]|uniref:hypothetical protein n=1 Tax=Idiomarina sp. TaxID=1874361 RepID=UPI000C536256|nr:hypothetical protein [Idiomarina sp.]MBT41672.1 hypothetical protein [Idiomarina sp.]|tara:strand:+ start:147 stop:656 length:510 start_codon:yes stop_codon:yes gene_type:complete
MIRQFLPLLPIAAIISGCSGEPENPAIFDLASTEDTITTLNGHWVHNPGACDNELHVGGLYDLKINNGVFNIGDTGKQWDVTFAEFSGDKDSLRKKLTSWSGSCGSFNGEPKPLTFVSYQTKHNEAVLAIGENNLFIVTSDGIEWLAPFDSVDLSSMAVIEPEMPKNEI